MIKRLLLALMLMAAPLARAGTIASYPSATLPLSGQELTLVWQNGTTRTLSIAGLTAALSDSPLVKYSASPLQACTGPSFDDTPAMNAAIAAGVTNIQFPMGGNCYFANGWALQSGTAIDGQMLIAGNPPGGTRFTCGLNANPCLGLGNLDNSTESVNNISVVRAAGTVPSGAKGIFVNGAYNVSFNNVMSYGHYDNWYFYNNGTNAGISANVTNGFSGSATHAHVAINSWPELRWSGGRIGVNGSGDVAGAHYIYITGSGTASGVGPNGAQFHNVQFNQGAVAAACLVDFDNVTTPAGNQVFYDLIGDHVENLTNYFCMDGSSTQPSRIGITNSHLNTPVPFFASGISSGIAIDDWGLANNYIAASTFAPPFQTINGLRLSGNTFDHTAVTLSPPGAGSNWTVASVGNVFDDYASETISGSYWAGATFNDVFQNNSTCTNTATPNTPSTFNVLTGGCSLQQWTPSLQFGGVSTGITYSVQRGDCQLVSGVAHCEFQIALTNAGSSLSGNATITGLPYMSATSGGPEAGGAMCHYSVNFQYLTGPISVEVQAPTATALNLYMGASTGLQALQQGSFTNTATLYCRFEYDAK